MEVENQLGDANIYEEVLNNICRKGEFVLVLLTVSYLRMPSLPELIFFQKLYQGRKLLQIVDIIVRIFPHFWISNYNQLLKSSNQI